MAELLPQTFPIEVEQSIASYDGFDLATGAGFKRFWACASGTTGGTTYFLTTKQIDGDGANLKIADTGSGTTTNFDIAFAESVTILGTALCNFTTEQEANKNIDSTITIYHVSAGGTATSLGAATLATSNGSGSSEFWRWCLRIPLTTKLFAAGDSLRIAATITKGGTAGGSVYIYFDPNSRSGLTETGSGASIASSLVADIPFKIDL